MIRLGLIPARGGSERLPGKNTIDLGGKPLIAWTIEVAKASGMFDRLICSTDDHGTAAVAERYGCEVLERPRELAQADSSSLDVVLHANSKVRSDQICLLQPTSPFRSVDDILASCELMALRNADAVVSVTEAQENAFLAFDLGLANRLRAKPGVFVCNGAIYLITGEHLLNRGNWYNGITYGHVMPKDRSLDIDTKADLERARSCLVKEAAA